MTADLISATPNPTVQGGTIEVCYDFTDPEAPPSTTLHLEWTPDTVEGQSELLLNPQTPCGEVAIPHDAAALRIVDDSGVSLPAAVAIAPSS